MHRKSCDRNSVRSHPPEYGPPGGEAPEKSSFETEFLTYIRPPLDVLDSKEWLK